MTKIPSWTFFSPNICFHPLIKDEKNVFCRGQHFPWISLYFPDSQELLEGYSWALGILELSPLIFLPPSLAEAPEQQFPQIPFLLPPSTKSGVYYSHKKYFLLDFPKYWRAEVLLLQNGLFLWKLVILSWPRNPELIGYFMEFFGE